MAEWPDTGVQNLQLSRLPTWIWLFIARLTGATASIATRIVQHGERSTTLPSARLTINRLILVLQQQYVRKIDQGLSAQDVVQLMALCGLVGALYAWGKRRTYWQTSSTSYTPGHERSDGTSRAASAHENANKGSKFDAKITDPGLLRKHSSLKAYTTPFGTYPAIRVFKRDHPQADKLPSKPTPLPLLVFIHGLGGSLAQFHSLLTSLVNVAPCLGIDLPGCGVSAYSPTAWDAYTPQALVTLIATIIIEQCKLAANQAVVLVGHSMGCSLAASLASTNSPLISAKVEVIGLIAICPKAVRPTDRELLAFRRLLSIPTPIFDVWRRWDRRGGPESASVARFVGPGADAETKTLQEKFNAQSRSAVWRRMAWGLFQGREVGTENHGMAGLEVWERLKIPIFLVAGESDKITKAGEVAAIARALGKVSPPSSSPVSSTDIEVDCKNPSSTPTSLYVDSTHEDRSKSNTETTILGDHQGSSTSPSTSLPSFIKRRQVLKTSILPAPAAHSLLYDPTTYRTLAGLIQAFLWDHIDSRLSLGWQLQHLSTEGKWDVKNLEKWQAVRPVSEPIAHIFLALKTLREVDDTHSPVTFVRNWKNKLKAVVDISHEEPVYDPKALESGGIEYHKFPTVSKIPPTEDEVRDFIRLVDKVRRLSPSMMATDALVGVHCHYGYNRTGFFICAYLIEKEGYGVQQAIDEFRVHRPPGIRHNHFLDTLFVRYCIGLERAPTL